MYLFGVENLKGANRIRTFAGWIATGGEVIRRTLLGLL
jgi:hypothetical protein